MSEPNGSRALPFLGRTTDRAERVAGVLRVAIVSGGFIAGERLVPERIAIEVGVSRPLVIAAIRQLEREGLVTIGTNGRPHVVGLTSNYVAELYRFRLMLDQAVVSALADRPLPVEAAERMHTIVAGMKAQARAGTFPAFADLDMDFHSIYLALAENRFLVSAWEAISDVAFALLTVTDRLSQALPLIAEIHEEIHLGLQAADGPRVLAALHRHYQTGEHILAHPSNEPHHRPRGLVAE